MAVTVGSANIILRVSSANVEGDIRRSLAGVSRIGASEGKSLGDQFTKAFKSSLAGGGDPFTALKAGFSAAAEKGREARIEFENLIRRSITLGTAFGGIVGGISSAIGGLGALIGAAGGAGASLLSLGSILASLGTGMGVIKLAFSGISKALTTLNKNRAGGSSAAKAEAAAQKALAAANQAVLDSEKALAKVIQDNREQLVQANNDVRDAQLALNQAYKDGQEEIKQAGFDAEDAALAEKKAALNLQQARINLAKAQDLPPNSAARQEAELAFQEADLAYRKAKDSAQQTQAVQTQLNKTGVAGTKAVTAATDALAKAEANRAKVVRDAAQAQADAENNVAKAQQAAKDAAVKADSGGGGGVDPFAKLTEAQVAFVKFIQSIKPQFNQLKEIAANSFLPPLQAAITTLMTAAFPVVAKGIGEVGTALGTVVTQLADAITTSANLQKLGTFFAGVGPVLIQIGQGLGTAFSIFLTLLNAVQPVAIRFLTFVNGELVKLDNYLTTVSKNGELAAFFKRSGDIAAEFGKIFGNIFAGFGAIIRANFAPGSGGDIMIQFLLKATQGFKDLDSTASKKAGLDQFFKDTAINATKVLGAIGTLIKSLATLGEDKNIGKTFDVLKQGAPFLADILKKSIDAGPSFAALVVSVIKFLDAFANTGQATAFFDTLKVGFDALGAFFNNPVIQKIEDALAPLQGTFEAIGLGVIVAGKAFAIFVGYVDLASRSVKAFSTVQKAFNDIGGKAKTVLKGIGDGFNFLVKNPILILILALAAAFILLYNTNKNFKKQIDEIVNGVLKQLMAAVQPLLPVFSQLGGILGEVSGVLSGALGKALNALAPILILIVKTLADILTPVIKVVATIFKDLAPIISKVFEVIKPLIPIVLELVMKALTPLLPLLNSLLPLFKVLGDVLEIVATLLGAVISTIVDVLTGNFSDIGKVWGDAFSSLQKPVEDLVTNVTTILTNVGDFITTLFTNIGDFFTTVWNGYMDIVRGVAQGIYDFVTTIFTNVFNFFQTIFTNIGNFISTAWNGYLSIIRGVVTGVVNFVSNGFNGLINIVRNVFNTISGIITGIWNGILSSIKAIINTILGVIQGMVNGIIDGINGGAKAFNSLSSKVGGPQIGLLGHVTIPKLAKGGVVDPSPGGTIVKVAEAGKPERIEPLDANGLSARDKALIDHLSGGAKGATFNIYAQPGQDVHAIAAEVDRIISFKSRKGGS